jgi:uncharacterized membrane protein
MEAFSDGVFAIAITLLILEISLPHAQQGQSLAHLLRHEWPSYFGYVVSFIVIGVVWWNHHELFKDIEHVDHALMVLNLALLLCIAFVPFPTGLMAEYVRQGSNETVAVMAYGATFTLAAIVFNALWLYVAYPGRLLSADVSAERRRSRSVRYAIGPVAYGSTVPLALVSFWISLALFAALAVLYLLPSPE